MLIPLVCAVLAIVPAPMQLPPTIVVDRDNIQVTESCVLVCATAIADRDGNGVVHIVGEGITVDLGGCTLDSGIDRTHPELCVGIGITVKAKGVTLTNGAVRGFKCAIRAESCDNSVFAKLDLSDNYAALLKSTKEKEDESDWLYPHDNDEGQQVDAHGAGLSVSLAKNVVIHDVRARRTQNGIVLRCVDDSKIYDNDCSFLSGWGLALWRCSRNTICRNSFDFCIRGYSHGVYNRGQDSAGILMFEQCCDNTVALNSCTHCGDGIFGFAGKEALGEKPRPPATIATQDPLEWYRGRGCCNNLFALNDLSYAAAHGLEMTFSFGNRILANRFVENGINGVWAGYSRDTTVVGNDFNGNVSGGFAGEHTQRSLIARNQFSGEKAGVLLWDDSDPALIKLAWTTANGSACVDNSIVMNTFTKESVGVGLRETLRTVLSANIFDACASTVDETECVESARFAAVPETTLASLNTALVDLSAKLDTLPGSRAACGARESLRGRANIIMDTYGPREPVIIAPTPPAPTVKTTP